MHLELQTASLLLELQHQEPVLSRGLQIVLLHGLQIVLLHGLQIICSRTVGPMRGPMVTWGPNSRSCHPAATGSWSCNEMPASRRLAESVQPYLAGDVSRLQQQLQDAMMILQ